MDVNVESTCLCCFLKPILSPGQICGIELIQQCSIQREKDWRNNTFRKKANNMYKTIVECYAWFMFIMVSFHFLAYPLICEYRSIFSKENILIIAAIFIIFSLYTALQYSLIRRSVLPNTFLKLEFELRKKIAIILETRVWVILALSFLLLVLVPAITTLLIFPLQRNTFWGFICCYGLTSWYIIIASQWTFIFTIFSIIMFVIYLYYNNLSYKLNVIIKHFRGCSYVDELIDRYVDAYEVIQNINNLWKHFIPIAYFNFIHVSCLLLYSSLLLKMHYTRGIIFAIIATVFLAGTLIFSWGLSKITSSLYGNFIQIGTVSSADICIEKKLKILNFMKRFARIPIGISANGFFFVKKTFLIKVASGLYSGFSTIYDLRKATKSNICSEGKTMENLLLSQNETAYL